jgi:hypothetical protein
MLFLHGSAGTNGNSLCVIYKSSGSTRYRVFAKRASLNDNSVCR